MTKFRLKALLLSLATVGALLIVGAKAGSAHAQSCGVYVKVVSGDARVDLNGDGDANDPGEYVTFNSASTNVNNKKPLPAIEGMTKRANGTWADDAGNIVRLGMTVARQNSGSPTVACGGSVSNTGTTQFSPDAIRTTTKSISATIYKQLCTQFGCHPVTLTAGIPITVHPAPTHNDGIGTTTTPEITHSSAACSGNSPIITVSWNSSGGNPPGYNLYYATTPSLPPSPTKTFSSNDTTSFSFSGSQNTTYYVLVQRRSDGASSSKMSVRTGSCSAQVGGGNIIIQPIQTVSLSAQSECYQSNKSVVRLDWTITGSNPTSFYLYQNGARLNAVPGTWRSYTTGEAIPGTTLLYRVDLPGGIQSNAVAVTAKSCGSKPASFSLAAPSAECVNGAPVIRLDWSDSAGANHYNVLKDSQFYTAVYPPDSTDLLVSAASNTDYQFYVIAMNTIGPTSSETRSITTPDCTPQASVALAAVHSVCSTGKAENILSWSPEGDLAIPVTYSIQRDGQEIATQPSSSATVYTDTTATHGVGYKYQIVANYNGESAPPSGKAIRAESNYQAITTAHCLPAPGSFTGSATASCVGSEPQFKLSWEDSSNTQTYTIFAIGSDPRNAPDQIGYIDKVSASTTTYTIPGKELNLDLPTQRFSIQAVNTSGQRFTNFDAVANPDCQPQNQPPVAGDDTGTTSMDTTVDIPISSNDTDPDWKTGPFVPDFSCYQVTQQPQHGTVTLKQVTPTADGAVAQVVATYTPDSGYVGTDTFMYQMCDDQGATDTATVTIDITATSSSTTPPPTQTSNPPGDFTLAIQNICAGDVSQRILTWDQSKNADNYTVERDGQILKTTTNQSYTDDSADAGNAHTYVVTATNSDGSTQSNTLTTAASKCATSTTENKPPQANDDAARTVQDSFVVVDVLKNDTDPDGHIDPTCVLATSNPSHGKIVIDPQNGQISYTPESGFSGTDSFIYQVCDDNGATDTATVTVVVDASIPEKKSENQPPVVNDDAADTPHDQAVDIDVLANDTDPDSNLDPTCVKITQDPAHGETMVNEQTGAISYIPNAGYAGTDTFHYSVCDTAGLSGLAQVSVAVGQAPPITLASTGGGILSFIADLWQRLLHLFGL